MISLLASVLTAFSMQLIAPLMQIYTVAIFSVLGSICTYGISILALYLAHDTMTFMFDSHDGAFGFLHPRYGQHTLFL